MSTTWAQIRAVLKTAIASILACNEAQIRWSTDSQPMADLQVRLSVISELGDADARRDLDPNAAVGEQLTFTEPKRLQIEVMIETGLGEYDTANDAQYHASRLRVALQRDSIRDTLKAAGVVLVDRPGPIRSVDYEARETGYWICARAFELPIRCHFVDTDPDFVLGQILRVTGSSVLAGGETVDIDVTKP